MSYLKIVTSLVTSESINFDDTPDIQLLTTYNSYTDTGAGGPGLSRTIDSRRVLGPVVSDPSTPLLDGQRCRTVVVEAIDGPLVIDYDGLDFCTIPEGQTMTFTALGSEADQAKYGVRSNHATNQYWARIITTSYDTL